MEAIVTEKRCSKCKETKPVNEFWKNKRSKDGLEGQCKSCHREYWQRPDIQERDRTYKREWARKRYTPERGKNNNLRANHGITLADYERMYQEQDGRCAICGREFEEKHGRGVHVDHDHDTGANRSLLCNYCNLMIGYAKDNILTLMSAALYLEKWT